MAEITFSRVLTDPFVKHVSDNRNGRDPDVIVFECIEKGIAHINNDGAFENFAAKFDAAHTGSEKRKIFYKEIREIGPIFSDFRLRHGVRSRRNMVREAILIYCLREKILKWDPANGKAA